MRIYFIRHGHPDYKTNTLTPLGHAQAEAMALAMQGRGVEKIYSSPYGRAMETAEHLAAKLSLPIETLEFMHEVKWQSPDRSPEENKALNPWTRVRDLAQMGYALPSFDYSFFPGWDNPVFQDSGNCVVENLDAFLETLGYRREGNAYRVVEKYDGAIAIVAHGGSSSFAMAHIINMHPMTFCGLVHTDFASICEISLDGEAGCLCAPLLLTVNEHAHILGVAAQDAAPQE